MRCTGQVWAKDFWTKEVYLGVRLGQRGMRAQLSGGMFSQFVNAYRAGEQALGLTDEAVRDGELAALDRAGRAARPGAVGQLACAPGTRPATRSPGCSGTRWPGRLGDPPPSAVHRRRWGAGEIESLVEGQIHNGRTVLRLEHPAGESYVAFLSFSRFPDVMSFPDGEPWLHFADSLPFPVEISSRMRLIPPAKASKDVGRRLAHARDMDAHIREAGADLPLALAEQIEAARMLEHGITKERLPFVYGWHRLVGDRARPGAVPAPGRGAHRALPRHRHRRGQLHRRPVLAAVRVAARRPGQAQLLPAAPAAVHDRRRRADGHRRPGRPAGRATTTGWIGPYIGETLGRARSVVHFDPLVAAARNRPTAVAITGEPGGGKTTLALLLIMQLALRGVTVAVIDPKGDAESLVDAAGRTAAAGPGCCRSARRRPGCSTRSRSATTSPRSGPWPPRRCGCCCRG